MNSVPRYLIDSDVLITAYDNKFSVASWKPQLTDDAQTSADHLTKPMLMVASPAIALPAGAEAYAGCSKAPVETRWLGKDVTQFDFYNHQDTVTTVADAITAFLAA